MRRLLPIIIAATFAMGCSHDKHELDAGPLLKHNFIEGKGSDSEMKKLLDQRSSYGPMDGAARLRSIKSQDGIPFERNAKPDVR